MPADGRITFTRILTPILLTWRIRLAPTNASSWQNVVYKNFNPYPANVEIKVSS